MNKKLLLILSPLCTIFIVLIVYYVPFDTRWSSSIEALSVSLALLISGGALFYAKREYDQNRKREKTSILCQYLQRFANEPYIKKVEDYILEVALLDKNQNIIGFDKNKKISSPPSIWDKEMFMHFFEEIQLLIEDDMIDKNLAIDLIGYYVGIYHRIEEFHADITDYNEERYWKYYLKFVNSIPDSFYEK